MTIAEIYDAIATFGKTLQLKISAIVIEEVNQCKSAVGYNSEPQGTVILRRQL